MVLEKLLQPWQFEKEVSLQMGTKLQTQCLGFKDMF